jgi:hypothetical protein
VRSLGLWVVEAANQLAAADKDETAFPATACLGFEGFLLGPSAVLQRFDLAQFNWER